MMEVLAPAGNREKMMSAFNFGADAVYLAGKKFGLRAFAGNFEDEEIIEACTYAHSIGKKVYVTLNIVARNSDFEGLNEYLEVLKKAKVDGVIVSDVGMIKFIHDNVPEIDIHVSTQANILNKYSAQFFCDMGVTRIVLARELSLKEIKEIREFIPKNIEIECFCHGAMCISYSGRCLLSNYLTGRDSNRGACVQACRWEYSITEKSRQNEKYEIQEDNRGTYILNSKDLCMIKYLKEMEEAGVNSLKIEGRMKSSYYVANVVNAYRRAVDLLEKVKADNREYSEEELKYIDGLYAECVKSSHRNYTTAFYLSNDEKREYLETSMPVQTHEFMAIVLEDAKDGYAIIEQRNNFKVGDELEVLSPSEEFNKKFIVEDLLSEDGEVVEVANRVQQVLKIKTNLSLKRNDILRKKVN